MAANASLARAALIGALVHGIAPIKPPVQPQHPSIPDLVVALLGANRQMVPVGHPALPDGLAPVRPQQPPQGLPAGIPLGLLQWLSSPGFYESAMASARGAQHPIGY